MCLKIFQNKYCSKKFTLNSAFIGHDKLCSFWRVLFAYLIHTVLHIIRSPLNSGQVYFTLKWPVVIPFDAVQCSACLCSLLCQKSHLVC